MRKIILIILILTAGGLLNAQAQNNPSPEPSSQLPQQTITLKDGTVLKGHLNAVSDNSYVIATTNLGQVHVPAENVVSITVGQPQAAASSLATVTNSLPSLTTAGPSPLPSNFAQAQQAVLQDPQMMAEIQTLISDEKIQSLLQDKSVMQDLMTMNPQIIEKNPAIQALMQEPKMQALMEKLSSKMGASAGTQGNLLQGLPTPAAP